MKLWVVMFVIMTVIIVSGVKLEHSLLTTTDRVSQSLSTIEEYIRADKWSEAEKICRETSQDWGKIIHKWNPFLHNQELDLVAIDLARLLSLLENREKTDALVEIAGLKVQLVQLHHQEILTLQNIF
ncbi:MAG: DUF4363 family protein [Firmicutes bacterium]|jgi:hypothetical protein|nr:DUF4363 family protein [Bacillota bacterium]NLO65815.1 DUF4363 family protein [Bacillota bacterium]